MDNHARIARRLATPLLLALLISGCEAAPGTTPTATAIPGATLVATGGSPSATLTMPDAELYVTQIVGMRGCGQPAYAIATGLPPRTAARVEETDTHDVLAEGITSDVGYLRLRIETPPAEDCAPDAEYHVRVVDPATSREFAAATLSMPVLSGRIEVDPATGGCDQITVIFYGFPPNAEVDLIALAPQPLAHDGFQVVSPSPVTDAGGFARTQPFRPPWSCDTPALSLTAFVGDGPSLRGIAELLYRIALSPDAPLPGLD